MTLELFHNDRSTCSQKVRICLAERELDWGNRHIDRGAGEHLTTEYLAINPNGVVPALLHDGRPIIESTVICEYLAEVFPGSIDLAPHDPVDRAAMRAWLRFIDEVPSMAVRVPTFNNIVHLYQNMSADEFEAFAAKMPLRKHFFLRMGQDGFDATETSAALDQLQGTIDRMEQTLEDGPWTCGAQYTIADLCLAPLFVRMEDLGMADMWAGSPRVTRWYERITARSAFQLAFYEGSRMTLATT
jgi:glutathione S-transferase